MSLHPRPTRDLSARAFRALLALYPAEFRDEYGRELALVFADRYRAASGPWERVLLWLQAAWGVLVEAPKEHVQMMLQDLRYALRSFLQKPLFAGTVIATLALGIGANTAVFQLIDAVRLRSLPVRNPHELTAVRIAGGNGGFGTTNGSYAELTRPVWLELKAHQQAFSSTFAWGANDVRIGEDASLRRAHGILVSGDFFATLGVPPFRGRLIEPADEGPCPISRVVVSHAYWQREMGGRAIDGHQRLRVDGDTLEVVGVSPPGFFGLAVGEAFDVARPLCQPPELRREIFEVAVIGRRRPGWTVERASAHVEALSAGIFEATAPTDYSAEAIARFKAFRLGAYPAAAGVSELRAQYDSSLWLLLGITGLVLLIACANLANLMLARAAARDREVAVRLALGASRLTLVRQLVAESGLLAVMGAALGVGLAQVLSRVLVWALATEAGAPTLSLTTNWRVLLFTALVAVTTCLVFGVAPAVRATRVQATAAMRAGARGTTADRGRVLTQRMLVVTQIAVSLVLLVGALLFVRSFHNLMTFDPGMRQHGITVGFFSYRQLNLQRDALNAYQRGLVDEIRSLPGIISAASTSRVPLTGGSWSHGVKIDGVEGDARFTWVGPGYFETMGIPLVQGRGVVPQDTGTSPRVAVVNRTFVARYIADGRALGRSLTTKPEPRYPATTYEIVGVIPDTKYNGLRGETQPLVFAPDSQHPQPGPWAALMIQSSLDPATAIAEIKQRLAQTRPSVISEYFVLQSRVRDGLVRERLMALLAGFFGALAALLAMVGLYGMVSYAVAQRQQEIGIRVALGAARRDIVRMVMRDAGRMLAVGIIIGGGLSLLAARSASTLLFGLSPHDSTTIAIACLLLAVIAVTASFVPARRAARLDPLVALRQE